MITFKGGRAADQHLPRLVGEPPATIRMPGSVSPEGSALGYETMPLTMPTTFIYIWPSRPVRPPQGGCRDRHHPLIWIVRGMMIGATAADQSPPTVSAAEIVLTLGFSYLLPQDETMRPTRCSPLLGAARCVDTLTLRHGRL